MILCLSLSLEPDKLLIPHLSNKCGQILPVVKILKTLELACLALMIIWLELQMLGVN